MELLRQPGDPRVEEFLNIHPPSPLYWGMVIVAAIIYGCVRVSLLFCFAILVLTPQAAWSQGRQIGLRHDSDAGMEDQVSAYRALGHQYLLHDPYAVRFYRVPGVGRIHNILRSPVRIYATGGPVVTARRCGPGLDCCCCG
jgi:hypothetical protein